MEPPDLTADDWEMVRAVGRRLRARQFDDFTTQGEGCGWCRHPIRLRGAVITRTGGERVRIFSTGRLPDGVFLKACGTRRETRCPSCAAVYRGDARHLVRAGLIGGKGVDESVTERPAVLLTLTAPSFGPVHSAGKRGPCHPGSPSSRCVHGRQLACSEHHDDRDPVVGAPLCEDCYDFEGAVLQNACTPELWRRTTIYVLRHLAGTLGWTQRETKERVRLSFCRVAEFQRRGVVHLHAVIRADGVDGKPPLAHGRGSGPSRIVRRRSRSRHAPPGSRPLGQPGRRPGSRPLRRSPGPAGGRLRGQVRHQELRRRRRPRRPHPLGGGPGPPFTPAASAPDGRDRLGPRCRPCVRAATVCAATPTAWDTAATSCPSPSGYSTSFSALKAARAAWREAMRRGGDAGETADRSLERRLRAVGVGWTSRGEELWAAFQQRQRLEERRLGNEEWYSRTEQDMERWGAW